MQDSPPPVAKAATTSLDRLATDLDTAPTHRPNDGFDEHVLEWAVDGINRAVILTVIHDPDAVNEIAPPPLIVEHSAWVGAADKATATTRGTVADVHDPSAEAVARAAVETAFDRVDAVTEDDLEPVPQFL